MIKLMKKIIEIKHHQNEPLITRYSREGETEQMYKGHL